MRARHGTYQEAAQSFAGVGHIGDTRSWLLLAGVDESFRPWHGLRHTALTETAAAGVPPMFVQAKAGHAQGSTTERYLHASQTSYPDAAELAEARLFGDG